MRKYKIDWYEDRIYIKRRNQNKEDYIESFIIMGMLGLIGKIAWDVVTVAAIVQGLI